MKSPDAEREVQIRETYGGKPWSDPMFLLRLLDEARAEIARLRTPPEADVMVRAHRAIAEHVAGNPDGTMWWVTGTFVETVAGLRSSFIRELTEYGDQRAREADMKRFWAEFPGVCEGTTARSPRRGDRGRRAEARCRLSSLHRAG